MRAIVAVACLAILLLPATSASHCSQWRTSVPELATPTGTYVDNDVCQPGCIVSVWVYQESNGIPGLQRDDMMKDDTCHGLVEADHRIV